MDYIELINKLKGRGILFAQGLTETEIKEIQDFYKIQFPPDLKEFLSTALPISKEFINWRDKSKENVGLINDKLNWPLEGMLFDIEHNNFWLEEWGSKPEDLQKSFQQMYRRI